MGVRPVGLRHVVGMRLTARGWCLEPNLSGVLESFTLVVPSEEAIYGSLLEVYRAAYTSQVF